MGTNLSVSQSIDRPMIILLTLWLSVNFCFAAAQPVEVAASTKGFPYKDIVRINESIRTQDHATAKRLARQLANQFTSSGNLKGRADASYYFGLADFLESNDLSAELHLKEAAQFYSQCEPPDIVGQWKATKLILRLEHWRWSNILATRNGDVAGHTRLKNIARKLEDILYRRALGVEDNDNGVVIYRQLRNIPEVLEADSTLQKRRKLLEEVSSHSDEALSQVAAWGNSISADLERLSEPQFWISDDEPRGDYLTALDTRLLQTKPDVVERLKADIQKQINLLDSAINVCKSAKTDGTAVEGVNGSGVRWAYEFVDAHTSGKTSLEDTKDGLVVYQDGELIAKALVTGQSTGSSKSDLLFFDAKTLALVSHVRIPNVVAKVGRLPENDILYAVSITSGKYNYDDAPLVLCLVDLRQRQIDRVKLINDNYWLATGNPATISAIGNTIVLSYDESLSGQESNDYIAEAPTNPHFRTIDINLEPVTKRTLGDQDFSSAAAEVFRKQALSDKAALSAVGGAVASLKSRPYEALFSGGRKSARDSVADVRGNNAGVHFIRALPTGELSDIWLNALKSNSIPVGQVEPCLPGIFADGTLRCVVEGQPVFVRDGRALKPRVPNSAFAFNSTTAFCFPSKSAGRRRSPLADEDDRWSKKLSGADILSIDTAGSIRKVDFSRVPQGVFSKEPISKGYHMFPELGTVVAVAQFENRDGGNLYIHKRFAISDGSQIGPSFTNVTGNTGAQYSQDGAASPGWNVVNIMTEAYTSSSGFSVIANSDDGNYSFVVAEHLPEMATPLELRTTKEKYLCIIYAYEGIARYALITKDGKILSQTEWKFSSLDGKPLLLSERDLFFIPKPGGYDVYHVFEDDSPKKSYELYIRGGRDYAIVLPNGYYSGSSGCERLINLEVDNCFFDAALLAPWRNRPAEVLTALGGDPVQIEVLSKVTERWLKKLGNPERNPEPTAADIPSLSLDNDVPLWANSERVNLKFSPKPGTAPVKDIVVRVNGVDQQRGSNSADGKSEIERSIKLSEGQNWIEAGAIDEKGRSSNLLRFRTILQEAASPAKRFIIAMGVSKYRDSSMDLEFAAKDATDLSSAIKESTSGPSEILLLTNDQVTRESVEKIRAFLANATENDEVVAFCAGHGVLDSNLDYVYASHEFDSANPTATGIKLDDLVDAIGSSKSLKRLLLLDTCHSGQVGEKEEMLLAQMDTDLPKGVRAVKQRGMSVKPVSGLSAEGQQRFIEEMFLLPGLHRGINIIGASGGAEYALESAQWNNGVFTASIIEALRDKKADLNDDTRISVGELRDFLAQRVSELTKGAQKPSVVASERDQDFDLIRAAYKRHSASSTESLGIPSHSAESLLRRYYQSIESQDEKSVADALAEQVDYFSSGTISRAKALSDIRGDWKRYQNASYSISEFEQLDSNNCRFILEYSLMQGERPRRGKLQMSATLTSNQPQKIQSIKAKVISAK